jgi:hypothetical protein
MPITNAESYEALGYEYDLKFAKFSMLRERPSPIPFDQSPDEQKKMRNWAAWCRKAVCCDRFCRLCQWPLDATTEAFRESLCCVCREIETTLFHRLYCTNLEDDSNPGPEDYS